ncbi:MarR family transcriptional regulator [Pseudomonas sp. ICMP22404]|uniref:MarR family transcriptional regulator n=1 Tax=Pseudomonas sp. ICMP22404 TaxID=2583807 RepID=UPI00111AB9E5|nr:helix-turn-helix domain-containing protein [Pseudomonas sp. ICMP22404]TNF78766.1 MarR family transcriptional regulator [Pseudomonas sp. ICMP22404]
MDKPTPIASDARARAWLEQFNLGDRSRARKLLEAFAFVSRDDFINHMRAMLLREAESIQGTVALYAERELRHRLGKPNRLFSETRRSIRRAIGAKGPDAVRPTKAYDPSVGSEGIVAQMISQLCQEYPGKFLNHPGPEQIRRKRVRAFWVVTDLIGSGDRASSYLEAAWLVRSVRSWWSGKLMSFAVMAYSATGLGERRVTRHPSKPTIHIVLPCPTIDTCFSAKEAEQMKVLCTTYDPTDGEPGHGPWFWCGPSLGYGNTGALLVFAHGAPNNVPLMFHKASKDKKKTWTPLFPARVSAGISKEVFGIDLTAESISARLANLGDQNLAKSKAILKSDIDTGMSFLVLSALLRRSRMSDRALATRTGLKTYELSNLLQTMTRYGWIDSQRRLTDRGYGQLEHARKQEHLAKEAAPVGNLILEPYYPSSLRHPV